MFPMGYIRTMIYTLRRTDQFDKWFSGLKDHGVKIKVLARLARVENGNFGDHKQLADQLFELRFFFGGGLRIYYTIQGGTVVLLLAGGDKSSQDDTLRKRLNYCTEWRAKP